MSPKQNLKINRQSARSTEAKQPKPPFAQELLWALLGLLLTITSTFFPAYITNLPLKWPDQGLQPLSLGVTFQVGAVLLTGCLGGKNAGALSQIAYVMLGLFWLSVFAQGGGLEYIEEPTFGYILGFIPGAWVCGFLAFRRRSSLETLAFSALAGLIVIHVCGLTYLSAISLLNVSETLSWTTLPSAIMAYSWEPLPGQLVITCAVATIAHCLRQILLY